MFLKRSLTIFFICFSLLALHAQGTLLSLLTKNVDQTIAICTKTGLQYIKIKTEPTHDTSGNMTQNMKCPMCLSGVGHLFSPTNIHFSFPALLTKDISLTFQQPNLPCSCQRPFSRAPPFYLFS